MPGTFSNDLTLVEDGEVTTDYSLVGTLKTARALNDDYKIEGTNCVTWGVSSATGTGTAHILGVVPGAPIDFSTSGAHFFQWIKTFAWPSMDTQRAGGARIAVSSDAPPTAVRAVLSSTIAAGGTGYTVNDVLTLTGGTSTETATVTVTTVSGGVVTAVGPTAAARGMYTVLPTNPVSTTGGTGTGCTLTVTWVYTTTNTKEWFVGGADTVVVDGWVNYCVDIAGTPDLKAGTPVLTSVDRMGVGATAIATSKIATHAQDTSRYGTGITVNDGTSGSPVTMTDLLAYDNGTPATRSLGICTAQSGIFFMGGKFRIGTTGQTAVTVFKDTNRVLVYQPMPVAAAFYEIKPQGAGSFVTTFQLGTYSGGVASAGFTIRGADRYTHYGGAATTVVPSIWTLTCGEANTLSLLYGCAFSQMRSAVFKSDSEVRGCSFNDSGEITAGGGTFTGCTFLNLRTTAPISATYQFHVTTSTPVITSCQFINCATAVLWDRNADTSGKLDSCIFTSGGTGHAIELGTNTPTTISLVSVTFAGYGGTPGSNPTPSSGSTDAAIYNNSAKTITINVSGGTTPAVRNGAGATTVVNSTIALTVTPLVTGSEVRAYLTGTSTESDGTESSTGSSHVLSLPSGVAVDIVVLGPVTGSTQYVPVRLENKTFSVAQNLDPGQQVDRNFLNP
jgi:hypothetical protein